jgi:hypothetical protein
MKEDEVNKTKRRIWKSNNMMEVDAQGASRGLCTLWSKQEVILEHHIKSQH